MSRRTSLQFLFSALALLAGFVASQGLPAQSPGARTAREAAQGEAIAKASEAYRSRDFARSLDLYSSAMTQGDVQPTVPYNAACSAALCGQADLAFELLAEAADGGWLNPEQLKKDEDLKSLHADPRWDEWVRAMERAANHKAVRWNSPAFRVSYAEDLTDAQKAAGLSKLWAEAKFNFVNFHLVPNLDWDAEFMAFMPRVLATTSTLDYYRVLERFVAKLGDGHSNVYLPRNLSQRFNAKPALRTSLIEGKVVIVKVLGAGLAKKGVAVGQEVVAVDRMAVMDHAQKNVRPYVSASTPQDVAEKVYGRNLMRGAADQNVELQLRRADGEVFAVSVPRVTGGGVMSFFSRPRPFDLEMLEGNVAYVKLNSFSSDAALEAFSRSFDKIAAADGLILDLRENGGGNSSVGLRIMTYLSDQAVRSTRWYTSAYRPVFRAWRSRQPTSRYGAAGRSYPPRQQVFRKPVAVLIGPRTYSAAEDMVASLDMMGRGVLVGRPTGGSTGQPLMFDLPGGGRARVCTKHDSYDDGTPFVGVGIQPDVLVEPTVADVRSGVDRALEVARQQVLK